MLDWVEVRVKARRRPSAASTERAQVEGEQTSGVAPSHCSKDHPVVPDVGAAEGDDARSPRGELTARELTV